MVLRGLLVRVMSKRPEPVMACAECGAVIREAVNCCPLCGSSEVSWVDLANGLNYWADSFLELFVICAFGDWHEDVPEGKVGVFFKGLNDGCRVLIDEDAYDSINKKRLSDYPETLPWPLAGA